MSDNGKDIHPDPKDQQGQIGPESQPIQPPSQPEEEKYEMHIIYNKTTGHLSVNGPGDGKVFNEPICDWLLKIAGRYIENTNLKIMQEIMQSKIIHPTNKPRMGDIFPKFRR